MSILYFQNISFYVGLYNYSRRACCLEGNELHTLKLEVFIFEDSIQLTSTSHTFFTLDFLEFMDKLFLFGVSPSYTSCVLGLCPFALFC